MAILVLPIFKGQLIYDKTRLNFPQDYFNLFNYFNRNDNKGRIALLPQFSYWGWNHYMFGYGGSGFLWYGLSNPTLDRAFDGYSKYNENYYWELTQAIYSQNIDLFAKILEKYQITWFLVDKNILQPYSPKALYLDQIESMVSKLNNVKLVASFGKINVYHVKLTTNPKDFIFLAKDLPLVEPKYNWNNFDRGYQEYENYISNSW